MAVSRWHSYKSAPDKLLEAVYQYYRGGGLQTLQLTRASNLLILLFMIWAIVYIGWGCRWQALWTDLAAPTTGAIHLLPHSAYFCGTPWCLLKRLSIAGWLFVTLVMGCWAWAAAQFWLVDRPAWKDAQLVLRHVLGVRDRQLAMLDFDDIMKLIVHINNSNNSGSEGKGMALVGTMLDEEHICARVMRRENYMIAMFNHKMSTGDVEGCKENRGLLDFNVPLSKPLEWALSFVILGFVFDTSSYTLHPRFLSRHPHDHRKLVDDLQRRSTVTGAVCLALSPLLALLTLAYALFRYGEEVYRDAKSIGQRQYSCRARWLFREYNELPHYFDKRLARTYGQADRYMDQFHDIRAAAVCRLFGFIAGTLLVMTLAVMAVASDGDHRLELPLKKSALWWAGVFGAIVAVCRSQQPKPHQLDDPKSLLCQILDSLHYKPDWLKHAGELACYRHFSQLYQLKFKLLVNDLLGTITTPLVLLGGLPERAPLLVSFIREHTVHEDGVGWVCAMSVFKHDQAATIQSADSDMVMEKMRMSMASFAERHGSSTIIEDGVDQEEGAVDKQRASLFYKH
jgi:autophagy-related protein 9